MRSIDWLQLGLFVAARGADHETDGPLPGPGPGCQRPDLARPGLQTFGATHLSADGSQIRQGAGLERICVCHAALQPGELLVHLWDSAAAAVAAAQSPGLRPAQSGPGLQHGHELHHQHQLAELHRRIHDVLSLANGRAGDSQLRLGGDRDCDRGGAGAGHCPAFGPDAGQLLGGPGAHNLLPAAAHLRGVCRVPGVPRA